MTRQAWSLNNDQLTLFCHVQPAARQNQLVGLYDDCVKIQLKTAPIDGKANKALIEFLAKISNRPKSAITIQRGLSQRRKTITIDGVDEIPSKISALAEQ